jgi:hypothetical protein
MPRRQDSSVVDKGWNQSLDLAFAMQSSELREAELGWGRGDLISYDVGVEGRKEVGYV